MTKFLLLLDAGVKGPQEAEVSSHLTESGEGVLKGCYSKHAYRWSGVRTLEGTTAGGGSSSHLASPGQTLPPPPWSLHPRSIKHAHIRIRTTVDQGTLRDGTGQSVSGWMLLLAFALSTCPWIWVITTQGSWVETRMCRRVTLNGLNRHSSRLTACLIRIFKTSAIGQSKAQKGHKSQEMQMAWFLSWCLRRKSGHVCVRKVKPYFSDFN